MNRQGSRQETEQPIAGPSETGTRTTPNSSPLKRREQPAADEMQSTGQGVSENRGRNENAELRVQDEESLPGHSSRVSPEPNDAVFLATINLLERQVSEACGELRRQARAFNVTANPVSQVRLEASETTQFGKKRPLSVSMRHPDKKFRQGPTVEISNPDGQSTSHSSPINKQEQPEDEMQSTDEGVSENIEDEDSNGDSQGEEDGSRTSSRTTPQPHDAALLAAIGRLEQQGAEALQELRRQSNILSNLVQILDRRDMQHFQALEHVRNAVAQNVGAHYMVHPNIAAQYQRPQAYPTRSVRPPNQHGSMPPNPDSSNSSAGL